MEKVKLGKFGNVEYYPLENNKIRFIIESSDVFQAVANSMEIKDELTEAQIDYLNDVMDKMATQMSDYLKEIGIENEIFDHQIGYGQEIDNLVIDINADDLSRVI